MEHVMNKELTPTHLLAGDFVSENAVRGVFGHRRRTPSTTPTKPPSALPTNPPTAGGDTSPPAVGQRPLRRWSIAELIARAVAAPPADGLSHG
jgi:hypothetical protein